MKGENGVKKGEVIESTRLYKIFKNQSETSILPEFSFVLKFLVSVFSNLDRVQCDLACVSKFLSVEYFSSLHKDCPKDIKLCGTTLMRQPL